MSHPTTTPLPPFNPNEEAPHSSPPSDQSESLSPNDIREIKRFLSLFKSHWVETIQKDPTTDSVPVAPPSSPVEEEPFSEPEAQRAAVMKLFSQAISGAQETEKGFGKSFEKILEEIQGEVIFLKVYSALSGIFPLKVSLRHGTQEQKLFALTVLGDRFLQSLTGVVFEQRALLLKTTMRYLTDLTEAYSFIQNEGEPFNALHYELVEGSQTGNRTILEVQGFVIIRKNTQHIIRLGRALT